MKDGTSCLCYNKVMVKILKRNVINSRYYIRYINPTTKVQGTKWVCVSTLTHFHKSNNSSHRRKYLISLPKVKTTFRRRAHIVVAYDPPGDGSCLFGSVTHQLGRIGIFRTTASLRAEVVNFMRTNPTYNAGTHLQVLIPNED